MAFAIRNLYVLSEECDALREERVKLQDENAALRSEIAMLTERGALLEQGADINAARHEIAELHRRLNAVVEIIGARIAEITEAQNDVR